MTGSLLRRPTRGRGSRQRLALAVQVALIVGALGCANGEFRFGDPFDRQLTFDQAQHRYSVLMRWSQFEKAKGFVPRDERADFIERTKALSDARFTDFEAETVELDSEKQKASVRVTYTLYLPSSPYEQKIDEIQVWTRDGVGNRWQVRSTFEGLPSVASR